jgi:formylglycine-generating enzyme required for sulfatase activity
MITNRVLRGSSWIVDARNVRCALRIASVPGSRNVICGFRPVAEAFPPSRILRGGSWLFDTKDGRCAYRETSDPGHCDISFGFRPVAKANL